MSTSRPSLSLPVLHGAESQPRTSNPQPLPPSWREDFPINWEDDHHVTRREFTSFLVLISAAFFTATGLLGLRTWWQRWRAPALPSHRIAGMTDLSVGEAKLFHYPTADDPCLLVRVASENFVAYSQKCTHLSCPVVYQAVDQQFHCPCHAGRFAVADGRVLAGPPKRPLPRIVLAVRGEEIWATGVEA